MEVYPGFSAAEVLYDDRGGVRGVATRDVGLNKDGTKGRENYEPGMELLAVPASKLLLAEGARAVLQRGRSWPFSTCEEALRPAAVRPRHQGGLGDSGGLKCQPGLVQHTDIGLALDVRHVRRVVHCITWLRTFLSMWDLVVGLDYANPHPPHHIKSSNASSIIHRMAKHLEGGDCVAYAARVINEGGLQSIPKLTFPGGVLIGCSAGFLNVPKIKGTHTAMKSGMLAAENVFEAVQTEEREAVGYQEAFEGSWVYEELNEVRNIKPAFKKWGLFGGVAYAGAPRCRNQIVSRRYSPVLAPSTPRHRARPGIATPSSRRHRRNFARRCLGFDDERARSPGPSATTPSIPRRRRRSTIRGQRKSSIRNPTASCPFRCWRTSRGPSSTTRTRSPPISS